MIEMSEFQTLILDHYKKSGRKFPWRETADPYRIVVSEIMLQQTQTERVLKKFEPFCSAFSGFDQLYNAPTGEILKLWQGLGYNRRALALKEIAGIVINNHHGILPSDPQVLEGFPMIGKATAGSIVCFAYDIPTVFMETNIRRVFIHHFFEGRDNVSDREIFPLVEFSVYRKAPRIWYNALMDYGVFLKKSIPNPNRRSAHYSKQPPFENSRRQIRGSILRELTALISQNTAAGSGELALKTGFPEERVIPCLYELEKEGFIIAEQTIVEQADDNKLYRIKN